MIRSYDVIKSVIITPVTSGGELRHKPCLEGTLFEEVNEDRLFLLEDEFNPHYCYKQMYLNTFPKLDQQGAYNYLNTKLNFADGVTDATTGRGIPARGTTVLNEGAGGVEGAGGPRRSFEVISRPDISQATRSSLEKKNKSISQS